MAEAVARPSNVEQFPLTRGDAQEVLTADIRGLSATIEGSIPPEQLKLAQAVFGRVLTVNSARFRSNLAGVLLNEKFTAALFAAVNECYDALSGFRVHTGTLHEFDLNKALRSLGYVRAEPTVNLLDILASVKRPSSALDKPVTLHSVPLEDKAIGVKALVDKLKHHGLKPSNPFQAAAIVKEDPRLLEEHHCVTLWRPPSTPAQWHYFEFGPKDGSCRTFVGKDPEHAWAGKKKWILLGVPRLLPPDVLKELAVG